MKPALIAAALAAACVPQATPPPATRPGAPQPIADRTPGSGPPARAVSLAYGGSFCALREDGRVVCWGQNFASSLGDGTHEARSGPALLAGVDGVRELRGLAPYGFCALRADASLWCWGFGHTGNTTLPAAPVGPRPIARDVSAFGFAENFPGVCVRQGGGTASCTQLRVAGSGGCVLWADETRSSCLAARDAVTETPKTLAEAGQVSWAGGPHSYVIHPHCRLDRGTVWCTGVNSEGTLGDASRKQTNDAIAVPGMTDVVSLTDSGTSACAVRADGSAWCWGRNADRELVVPSDVRPCPGPGIAVRCNRAPTRLPVDDVAQVVLGTQMLVVTRGGDLLISRRAGPSPEKGTSTLERVAGIPPVATVVAGNLTPRVACALTKASDVYCLGDGADLGDGTPPVRRQPTRIATARGAAQVHVDVMSACAVLDDGTVSCGGDIATPRGLRDIAAVAQPCALARDGRVWCWGDNNAGEMGLGYLGRRGGDRDPEIGRVPLPVPGVKGIRQISSFLRTTCALDGDGVVRCWGSWGPRSPTLSPTVIRGLPPLQEIWTRHYGQCGLSRDHEIWCWRSTPTPMPVPEWGRPAHLPSDGPGPESPKEMCVLDGDASVRCAATPAPLQGLTRVRQLSLASERPTPASRGCAVIENGDLRCWGPPYCALPAALCGDAAWNKIETVLTGVRQVSVGHHLSCAVRTDGGVWCWGNVAFDALGTPVARENRLARVPLDRLAPLTAGGDR